MSIANIRTSKVTISTILDSAKKTGGKGKCTCGNCGKKTTTFNPFCNRTCKDLYFEFLETRVSPRFVKKVLIHSSNKQEAEDEILKFCTRMGYRYNHVIRRIEELFALEQLDESLREYMVNTKDS